MHFRSALFASLLACGSAHAVEPPPELCHLAQLSATEQYARNSAKASAWLQPALNAQLEFLESILKQIEEPQWKDAAAYVRGRNSILKGRYFAEETRRYDLRMHEGNLDMTRGVILHLIRDQEDSWLQVLAGKRFARRDCPDTSRASRPLPDGFGSTSLIEKFIKGCQVDRSGEIVVPDLERRFEVVAQEGEPSVIARTFIRGPLGDAALESRINLLSRQIEGRDLRSALRMASGDVAQAALLGPERSAELFLERSGVGLACHVEPSTEAGNIANLCKLAESRAVAELEQKQSHPLVITGEQDARKQAALLGALFVRLSAQDHSDLKHYKIAIDEARLRGPEAVEKIETFYTPLRDRLKRLLNRQSLFEGFAPTLDHFEEQQCPTPYSAALAASRISGRGDWRDTLRMHFPQFVSSCSVSGPNESKHTLPLLQRRAGVDVKEGVATAWASTFRQVNPDTKGAPTEMMLLETRWDLYKNQVSGTHFSDSLKLSSVQELNDAARNSDAAVDDYLRAHGLLDLCRPDVNFLENAADPRN